jgi:hypothetical protein
MDGRTLAVLAIAVMLAFVLGCSSRTGYDMLRMNRDLQCQKLQGADRDQCLRRDEMSYDEYQRRLRERDR